MLAQRFRPCAGRRGWQPHPWHAPPFYRRSEKSWCNAAALYPLLHGLNMEVSPDPADLMHHELVRLLRDRVADLDTTIYRLQGEAAARRARQGVQSEDAKDVSPIKYSTLTSTAPPWSTQAWLHSLAVSDLIAGALLEPWIGAHDTHASSATGDSRAANLERAFLTELARGDISRACIISLLHQGGCVERLADALLPALATLRSRAGGLETQPPMTALRSRPARQLRSPRPAARVQRHPFIRTQNPPSTASVTLSPVGSPEVDTFMGRPINTPETPCPTQRYNWLSNSSAPKSQKQQPTAMQRLHAITVPRRSRPTVRL